MIYELWFVGCNVGGWWFDFFELNETKGGWGVCVTGDGTVEGL